MFDAHRRSLTSHSLGAAVARTRASLSSRVRRTSYLPKWLILGLLIGAVAGGGAIVFDQALNFATHLFTGDLIGYTAPVPAGEHGVGGTAQFVRWWAVPLVVAAGGLVSGFLVYRFAPEAEGHGTDAAIDAIHTNPRRIRSRAVAVKLVASAVTIGSGGSGGREGPTAQISAGFGSLLARFLDLTPEDGRIAVSVGIGSGIGAIFGAPLGGAVTAADIVYRDDFETEALLPGFIASITAYAVFGLVEGFSPLFGYVGASYRFDQPVELIWFAVIGVLGGAFGLLYSKAFYGMIELSNRLPLPRMTKPALGGLLVGLLALAVPQVLGTGYGWVQPALDGPRLLHLSLWVVLVLPLAKILATSLSIGSGGSGGVFGPGLVIGAFIGAALWRLVEPLGLGVPASPAPFVIVGMMACFGSIARAPLAMMLMVAEMTGNLSILAPAMLAVGIAYLLVRHSGQTIYHSQLGSRAEAQPSRLRAGMPLLGKVTARDALTTGPALVLPANGYVQEAVDLLRAARAPGVAVVDDVGTFVGAVGLSELADGSDRSADDRLRRWADPAAPSVVGDCRLDVAIEALPPGRSWLTVLDDRRHVLGILTISDVVGAYQTALRAESRQTAVAASGLRAYDCEVAAGSLLDGAILADLGLPGDAVVMSVLRADSVFAGTRDLRLRSGDVITVLVRPEHRAALSKLAKPGATGAPC